MPLTTADRNLLYGLLALQMDFVSKDQLIEAMQAWALEKGTPLEQILQDRGHLTTEDHAALEHLLERHLARHGGSTEQSISTLSPALEVIESLSAVNDPEIAHSLAHLRTPPMSGNTFDGRNSVRSLSPGSPDSRLPQRFQIVRLHAQGGLGEVYVAVDTELNREVALKQIRSRMADHMPDRRRFVFEAEVTGSLEHPGIVPVYSLGQEQGTGRPFYAMRLIRGDSLKDAIAAYHTDEAKNVDPSERSLQLRRLITQLVDACNALAYAHDRGVLHRDIKPGNIMVGKYGETLVVDWGLAKVVGRPDDSTPTNGEPTLRPPSGEDLQQTLPHSVVGTPQYMPPEQTGGGLDLLGPPSDVYSLGATLYSILVGHPPYAGTPANQIFDRVRRGDYARPRSVDPSIPRPLHAICVKAMALQPGDRYPNARLLADDLERWLADEPVTAFVEPLSTRAWRWVRRHRTTVTTAAATLFVGLLALASLWRLSATNEAKLAQANGNLEIAQKQTARWLNRAMEAISSYYNGANEQILRKDAVPVEVREQLLVRPSALYQEIAQELAAELSPSETQRYLLATGQLGLGSIGYLLGRNDQARDELEASIRGFTSLFAEDPANPDYRKGLADSYTRLGDVIVQMDEPNSALRRIQSMVESLEKITEDHEDAIELYESLARTTNNLAVAHLYLGRIPDAEKLNQRAVDILRPLIAEHPEVPSLREALGRNLLNLGLHAQNSGKLEEAAALMEEGAQSFDLVSREEADVPDHRVLVGSSLAMLGEVLNALGRTEEASKRFQEGLEILVPLNESEPGVSDFRRSLAICYHNVALARAAEGNLAAAIDYSIKSVELYAQLVRTSPRRGAFQNALVDAVNHLVQDLSESGRYEETEVCRRAITLVGDGELGVPVQQVDLLYGNLISRLQAQGLIEEAVQAAREREALRPNNPGASFTLAMDLARCLESPLKITRDELGKEAVDALRTAAFGADLGSERLTTDPYLGPLKDREDFQQLVQELKAKTSPANQDGEEDE